MKTLTLKFSRFLTAVILAISVCSCSYGQQNPSHISADRVNSLAILSMYHYEAGEFTYLNGYSPYLDVVIDECSVDTSNRYVILHGRIVGSSTTSGVTPIKPDSVRVIVGELFEKDGNGTHHLRWSTDKGVNDSLPTETFPSSEEQRRQQTIATILKYSTSAANSSKQGLATLEFPKGKQVFEVRKDREFDIAAHIVPESYLIVAANRHTAVLFNLGKLLP